MTELDERLSEVVTDELGTRVALARMLARTFGRREPVRIGRYVLRHRLGIGGMGDVWAAEDPELGRIVAIKLLAPGIPRSRCVEGRALARLHHPGAVEVFEIGEHDGRVYIVMQHVAGCTLDAWLATDPPGRAIVEIIERVGRALADSHEAGLVHRDIKPTNVMLDEHGAVKLVDFGIALLDEAPTDALGIRWSSPAASTTAGTLAYMAPEQLEGRAASAKSDQFALCVIAWQALTGRPAFVGHTIDERLGAIATGPTAALPRHCPRALDRALRRGLASDPDARWPDVASLSRALRVAMRSRVRVAASIGGVAMAGLAGLAFAGPQSCEERALARTDLEIGSSASLGLQRYGERWTTSYVEACDASSAPAFDATMRCLDDALLQAAALRTLTDAGRIATDAADDAVSRLPSADECETTASPPDRTHVEVRERIAEVHALMLAMEHSQAEAAIDALRPRLAELDDVASTAKLELLAGILRFEAQDDAGAIERLGAALAAAQASADDPTAARAAAGLMRAHALAGDVERSDEYRRHAEATMLRFEPSARMRCFFANELAITSAARGAFDEAVEHQRLALELAPDHAGSEVHARMNLAVFMSRAGRHGEAIEQARIAMQQRRDELGDDHPALAAQAANVGAVEAMGGDLEAAERTFANGYRIARAAFGDDHLHTAMALHNLGEVALDRGDAARAVPRLREALAIRTAHHPPGHARRHETLIVLVRAQVEAGALADAAASQLALVAEIEASAQPSAATLVPALVELAEIELRRGNDVERSAALRRMRPWLDGAELPADVMARIDALQSTSRP